MVTRPAQTQAGTTGLPNRARDMSKSTTHQSANLSLRHFSTTATELRLKSESHSISLLLLLLSLVSPVPFPLSLPLQQLLRNLMKMDF